MSPRLVKACFISYVGTIGTESHSGVFLYAEPSHGLNVWPMDSTDVCTVLFSRLVGKDLRAVRRNWSCGTMREGVTVFDWHSTKREPAGRIEWRILPAIHHLRALAAPMGITVDHVGTYDGPMMRLPLGSATETFGLFAKVDGVEYRADGDRLPDSAAKLLEVLSGYTSEDLATFIRLNWTRVSPVAEDEPATVRALSYLDSLASEPGVFDFSESDEVAATMADKAPTFTTFDEASRWVRARMPDESTTIVDNTAESLMASQEAARRAVIPPPSFGGGMTPEAFDFLAEQEPGSMVAIGRRPGSDSVEFSRDPKSIGRAIDNPRFLATFGPFAAFRVYRSDESNHWREIARPIDGRLYPDTVAEWAPLVSPIFDGLTDRATVGRFEPSGEMVSAFRETRNVVGGKDSPVMVFVSVYRDVRRRVARLDRAPANAISLARAARDNGHSRRYPRRLPTSGVGAPFNVGSSVCRWVDDLAAIGLRFHEWSDNIITLRHRGHYTAEDGCGGGVCRGAVFLLPRGRIVPGFIDSENPDSAIVCFDDMRKRLVFDSSDWFIRNAATWGDSMAEIYAEAARDRDEAWSAGSKVADLESSIADDLESIKRNARTLNRLRREVAPDLFREVRFPIRTQSAMFANRIEESRREIEKIRDTFEGCDGFSEGLGID